MQGFCSGIIVSVVDHLLFSYKTVLIETESFSHILTKTHMKIREIFKEVSRTKLPKYCNKRATIRLQNNWNLVS